MAARAARLLHPVRAARSDVCALPRLRRRRDGVQQAAAIEGLDGGHGEAAQSERQPLQRRARVLGLLQHQHREPCEAQLARQQQADRTGAGNHDIIQQKTDLPSRSSAPPSAAEMPPGQSPLEARRRWHYKNSHRVRFYITLSVISQATLF